MEISIDLLMCRPECSLNRDVRLCHFHSRLDDNAEVRRSDVYALLPLRIRGLSNYVLRTKINISNFLQLRRSYEYANEYFSFL